MVRRVAGLDIGDKRIGIAVSDPLGLTAQPVAVVERRSLREDIACVLELVGPYEPVRLVVGLPLEMNATQGKQAARVRKFCDALAQASELEVVYQDERLTTVQSERLLIDAKVRRAKRRRVVDKLAAALILQAYLDARES